MKRFTIRVTLSFLFSYVLTTNLSTMAQSAIVSDIQGRPFLAKSYTDVKGSPYLFDGWFKGVVKLMNGTVYESIDLMYNQIKDELIFKASENQAQTFTLPIYEFTLRQSEKDVILLEKKFRRGFTPVDGASDMAFYEVLADGKTLLLKRTSKVIFEELPYGSSTKLQTIKDNVYYYINTSGKLIKIKKDKKQILTALNIHTAELEMYIKGNKLDLKQDTDLVKLISYYNTL